MCYLGMIIVPIACAFDATYVQRELPPPSPHPEVQILFRLRSLLDPHGYRL